MGQPGSPSSMQAASSFVHCTRPVSLFRTLMNAEKDRPRPFYPCTVVMWVPRNQLAGWAFMMSVAMTSEPSLIFYIQQTHKASIKFKMLQHRKFKRGKRDPRILKYSLLISYADLPRSLFGTKSSLIWARD